jgi:hypothetical protein
MAAAAAWSMNDSVCRPSCPLKEGISLDLRAWWIVVLEVDGELA